jgi:glucose/arabinose dehydrogenase
VVQAIVLLLCSTRARAQVYPPGFQDEFVVGGLQEPTTFLFVPDGRMLIAERRGRVRVVANGTLLSTSMLTLSVVTDYEQGLLGLALDPNFPSSPYLYVCYSHGGGSFDANRVSRWTVSGNTIVAGSELVRA